MRVYDDTFSGDKIYPGKVRVFYLPAASCGCPVNSEFDSSRELTMVFALFAGEALRSWGQQDLPFPTWQDRIPLFAA